MCSSQELCEAAKRGTLLLYLLSGTLSAEHKGVRDTFHHHLLKASYVCHVLHTSTTPACLWLAETSKHGSVRLEEMRGFPWRIGGSYLVPLPLLPHPEPVMSGYKERTGLNMEKENVAGGLSWLSCS